INPSVKAANPANPSRGQAGATTITSSTARNAIGQPIVSPKNFPGAQPSLPSLQRPGVVSPIVHAGPAAPPVSSGPARVNVANATNRGHVNGATVTRPTTGTSVVGGPAQARYGITRPTVQQRH